MKFVAIWKNKKIDLKTDDINKAVSRLKRIVKTDLGAKFDNERFRTSAEGYLDVEVGQC